MQRLLNVYHTANKHTIDNYENIDVSEIHNIVNHSVDFIKFNDLELFEYEICKQLLPILLIKLRLGGSIIIGLTNFRIISKLYSEAILSDDQLLLKINNVKSIWSKDLLIDKVKNSYKDIEISKIQNDNQNHIIYVTLTRRSI